MRVYVESIYLRSKNSVLLLAGVSLIITSILIGIDLYLDLQDGEILQHLLLESGIFISSFVGVISIFWRFNEEKNLRLQMNTELYKVQAGLEDYKKRALKVSQQFEQVIDEQFEKWGLSKAEKEIALLLIKGVSNKSIADLRETSEKTIRAHSTSIYKKSHLKTRYELAAYFIDGLFP